VILKNRTLSYAKVINPWEGTIIGKVLKSNIKISFLGDINPDTGEIIANDSDIKGAKISNKVLIFPGGRGSTVGAGVLFGLAKRALAPKILVTLEPEPVVISGAIFGDIPMISEISKEFFDKIKTGDLVACKILDKYKAVIEVVGE